MGTVYQAEKVELMDGTEWFDCTIIAENSFIAVNCEAEVTGQVDRIDFVVPWHMVKKIVLK